MAGAELNRGFQLHPNHPV